MTPPIRVLIVDDDALVRSGLTMMALWSRAGRGSISGAGGG